VNFENLDMISNGHAMRLTRQPFQHLTTAGVFHLIAGMNANLVTDAKFAFVVAEWNYKQWQGNDHKEKWQQFLSAIQRNAKLPAGMQTIHENVWLLPLANGLPFLANLIEWARSYEIPIRILFLAEAPDWIKYPPDATEAVSQTTP
jgi:hypothetical protein